MKAAIYCRVSTEEQGQRNYSSLDSQEYEARKHCDKMGWEVYRAVHDMQSAKDLNRPLLQDLISDGETDNYDILLVLRMDRISRNLLDFLTLKNDLDSKNVRLRTVLHDFDDSTSEGRAMSNIQMIFNQLERERVSERVILKCRSRAEKGMIHGGRTPLGYDVADNYPAVNKQEASLVRKIFKWYLQERSVARVAKKLNQSGYRNKKWQTKKGTWKGGKRFTVNSVAALLNNQIYIGKIRYKDKWFQGQHEKIIDREQFDQVQGLMKNNSRQPKLNQRSKSDLLLLGILKCGFCSKAMTTAFTSKKNGKRYHYYECYTQQKLGRDQCANEPIKADLLDDFVANFLRKLANDEKHLKLTIEEATKVNQKEIEALNKERESLQANINTIEKQERSLIEVLKSNPQMMQIESISKELQSLGQNKKDIQKTILEITSELNRLKSRVVDPETAKLVYKKFDEAFDLLSKQRRRELMQAIIKDMHLALIKGKKSKEGLLKINPWLMKPTDLKIELDTSSGVRCVKLLG